MAIQRNSRKCPLQVFCQNRSKFLILGDQPFCKISFRLTRQLEALHQLTNDMLRICCRTTITSHEKLTTVLIGLLQQKVCGNNIIPCRF